MPLLGAYLLVLDLKTPLRRTVGALGTVRLAPGRYVYAGNAWGPGGIAARLKRHLKRGKGLHWHIDHLTESAHVVAALALPGARECAIVARLLRASKADCPVLGFGASDCRLCPAHLLSLPGLSLEELGCLFVAPATGSSARERESLAAGWERA